MFGRKTTAPTELAPGRRATDSSKSDPVADFQSLWEPATAQSKKGVETLLLERGHITEEQLDQARKVAAQTPGKTLSQTLLTMNAATEGQILSALAETLGMPYEVPEKAQINTEAFGLLPLDDIRKNLVLPMRFEGNTLVLGMADPANVFMLDEVRRKTRRDVRAVAVAGLDINRIVEQITAANTDIKVDEIIKDMSEDEVQV